MSTWLSAIMLISAAAGFAVCAKDLVPRGRRRWHVDHESVMVAGSKGYYDDGQREAAHHGGTPVTAAFGMALMLAAMTDMTFEAVSFMPNVVWGLLLLLTGPLLLAGDRCRRTPKALGIHRSLSMIAMASVMVTGGHDHGTPTVREHLHGTAATLPILPILVVIGVLAFLVYTFTLIVGHRRRLAERTCLLDSRQHALAQLPLESCLAAVSVGAMTVVMFS